MMPRRSRAIEQTHSTFLLETRQPFVANPTAYPEPPANPRKRFLLLAHRHHKFHPLFHGTGLLPSHRQVLLADQLTCYPCRRSILLPIYPVRTLLPPSPLRGGVGGGGQQAKRPRSTSRQ